MNKIDNLAVNTIRVPAPAELLFEEYGFTVDNVVRNAKKLINK